MSRWLFFPSLTSLYGEFTYCQLANSQIEAWRPPILVGGTFLYCQLANSQIEAWRPAILTDGTFLYCAQDINQFNRTP